jgi:hypothetical protein
VNDDPSYELATYLYAGSVSFQAGAPAVAELPWFESGSVDITTGVELALPSFEECELLTIVGAGPNERVVVDAPLLTVAKSIILMLNEAALEVDAPALTAITDPVFGGGLSVFANPGLIEIADWFPALVTADVVDLSDNDALVSVSSLGSGAVATDGLTVRDNDNLTDVSGLLGYSPWFSSVIDNPLLLSCDAEAIVALAAFPFPGTCDGNALDECSDGDDPSEICTP